LIIPDEFKGNIILFVYRFALIDIDLMF